MYLNTTLVQRKADLDREIALIKKELNRLPEGSLIMHRCGKSIQWYLQKRDENGQFKRSYLKRESRDLAERLARKTFLRRMLSDKQNESKCLDHYISHRHPVDYSQLLRLDSPYRDLLADTSWDYERYDKSTEHPEHLIIPTKKGNLVRSKSEALIANALYDLNIPYRYEAILETKAFPMYPDFTIMSPKTGKIIYWEHFGKIDDSEYRGKMFRKLAAYTGSGYVPGTDLIMTFEDKMHPLTIDEVQNMIQHYLL